jgi:alkylation response protein AidB-like acyl-CoA dehydrogenase
MSDHAALLETAQTLRGTFREQSADIEQARRIPAALSQKMASAGLYRLGAPHPLGGLEVPPEISSRIFETLAQGDASCAWVSFIATTSCTSLAALTQKAASEIFSDPETLITGVFAPTGKAEKVAGGFRVSGRWQWGSGSQNADWVMGGCMIQENGEPLLDSRGAPRNHMMIMPRDDVTFHDTWHVAGLRGSGSLDYEVSDLFVPEERAVGFLKPDGPKPGALYTFPSFTFLALGIAAVCLGIARAAMDELIDLAASKRRVSSRKTIAEQPMAQLALARAEGDLRSARAFYYEALDDAWQTALAGSKVSVAQRRDLRLATSNAVAKAVSVVNEMYDLGGGSAVYENSRLQRHFRDINVAKSHIMVAPSTFETIGRLLFGLNSNVATL